MSHRKNIAILIGLVLSVSLFTSSLTALFMANYYNDTHFQELGRVCRNVIEIQPQAEQAVLSALKKYTSKPYRSTDENIILEYGYHSSDFSQSAGGYSIAFAIIGCFTGGILFILTLFWWRKKEAAHIKSLTDYLENVNTGKPGLLSPLEESDFSKLQDEIYKTVTTLYQTRDAALKTKDNYAENLSNIAHQIKTPITSISLSAQMMKENPSPKHLEQIHLKLSRLTYLEEALLLMSRIDSGTLALERKETDAFTVLMLAADNLQEVFLQAKVTAHIPELGQAIIYADLEWTMEAVMNLLKNCMEHTPSGGTVHCWYEQNPLYTLIRIWDTGAGFAKEDIPHLFERFYRGKNAKSGSIGIGLSLSKAIIERQNGTISAYNLYDGGACFEIHFYSH